MALFIAIVVLYLTQITYCPAQTILISIIILFYIGFIRLSGIDFNSWNGAMLLILLLIILAMVFLFFLPNFHGKLRIVGVGSCRFWVVDFRFFYLEVFYQLTLDTGLSHGSIGRLRASKAVLIYVASSDPRP